MVIDIKKASKWVKYSKNIGWNFDGRATRREIWNNAIYYFFIGFLINFLIMIVSHNIPEESEYIRYANGEWSYHINFIPLFLKISWHIYVFYRMFPIYIRRLHDVGKNGFSLIKYILLSLFCGIGVIILIITLFFKGSKMNDNEYGP